ncbi:hypothetical protein EHI8A_141900 [Entamoeba histolytica HM-1:IMSS-B]|uniref:Dilute domain-containing protein n=5 Tax=Entamoeba histolytica TaxID=5759 RepID=C4M754_ENTH1|nr:hypothetical protein EHI_192140 [Entamoeba histolytica HM-1:IMSS]EMH75321.1 hypothetical protein EHI8A_141900 [Entamoeba histolytica HM-1:IMSS-B]EMS13033.1 hypothetical protein KM1_214430 [Entamoeba histolytica HM-3:IMSS]ENY65070.1 hypothetical protein EHI7A_106530 [Entamoeba histolytica HM-1:IMSS-A]GAT97344.1 hypothetical protein CL6EHI_192140 [Entamoeba histolytica]EAL44951.1 hypothetical protein EHI_192140 [Entamoeba histolytica HM-1:IMSS]|eukprot:XP_650337.1 hypothetical protein EHI_192140 [Entamoeba histolytica HM-1:IMSS]
MSHRKIDVKLTIQKVFSSAPESSLSQFGFITCTYSRGDITETTQPFEINKDLNQTFNFLSTFIVKSQKEGTYKEKELQFVIKTVTKKKELFKTSVNLSKFVNSITTSQILNFTYKNLPMQLLYSLQFSGQVHQITKTSQIPQLKRQITSITIPLEKQSAMASSITPTTSTPSKQTTASSQISSGLARSARDARSQNCSSRGDFSGGSVDISRRVGHQRVKSAFSQRPIFLSEMNEVQKENLPEDEAKFVDDIKQVTSLMQFDLESKNMPMTNTLMSELIFEILIKKKAFDGKEDLLEATNTALEETISNDLLFVKQAIYLYSSISRLCLLFKKEYEKSNSSQIGNFIKVLSESIKKLYTKLFEIIKKDLQKLMELIFNKSLMSCDELINFIDDLRKMFEQMRVTKVFINIFVEDLLREINILFIEEVVNPSKKNCCTTIGMNSVMIISFLQDYFRKPHIFQIDCKDQFSVISETSRVLLLNDKSILSDNEARTNICPHLSLAKITSILENLIVKTDQEELSVKKVISQITNTDNFTTVKFDYSDPLLNENKLNETINKNENWEFIPFDLSTTPLIGRNYFK